MDTEERKKRNIAFEKKISELSKEDVRVTVVGTVIEKDATNNSIVIDDGQFQLRILFNEENFDNIETGKLVRVMGTIVPALEGDTVERKGEIIQDFSGLDPDLYAKYLKIKNV